MLLFNINKSKFQIATGHIYHFANIFEIGMMPLDFEVLDHPEKKKF